MGSWSGYEYKTSGPYKARKQYRCQWCRRIIQKGKLYEQSYGGLGKECYPICPPVKLPLMPKGIEHLSRMSAWPVGMGQTTSDAERR